MSSDGRDNVIHDCSETRCDSHIEAWNRRLTSLRSFCAGTARPIGVFDILSVRQPDEAEYLRNSRNF